MSEGPQQLLILTGMSGAGKSTALRMFEDLGYYCIDNLPPTLIGTFLSLYEQTDKHNTGVAVVCDLRSGDLFARLRDELALLRSNGLQPEVLYFDCDHDVLVSRFETARRIPPLGMGMRLVDALAQERSLLAPARELATQVIDTTELKVGQLRDRILQLYAPGKSAGKVTLTLLSFGFKYGLPADADFVFDTRFLPNPFYVEKLSAQSGNDAEVRQYVMDSPVAQEYLATLRHLLSTAIPHYTEVHKLYAVAALGCTGGRHRSVTLVNLLAEQLSAEGIRCVVQHRDIDRS
ncbi:RNase adapter RapZ [bacterium]|nr:RNase adapter RapZ [bacterium]